MSEREKMIKVMWASVKQRGNRRPEYEGQRDMTAADIGIT